MFHEFGHALHGMFADTEYPSLWHADAARLRRVPFAVQRTLGQLSGDVSTITPHYKTGAPMPRRTGGQDQEGSAPSTRATADRDSGRRRARHGVAHAARHRATPESRHLRGGGA